MRSFILRSIQALISSETDLFIYKNKISRFVKWCGGHFLLLNLKKTKEVIFIFLIERVKEYKYLGVVLDEKLDWSKNNVTIQK